MNLIISDFLLLLTDQPNHILNPLIITVDFYFLELATGFYAPELLKLTNVITFAVCMKVHQFGGKALPIHAVEHAVLEDWAGPEMKYNFDIQIALKISLQIQVLDFCIP